MGRTIAKKKSNVTAVNEKMDAVRATKNTNIISLARKTPNPPSSHLPSV